MPDITNSAGSEVPASADALKSLEGIIILPEESQGLRRGEKVSVWQT